MAEVARRRDLWRDAWSGMAEVAKRATVQREFWRDDKGSACSGADAQSPRTYPKISGATIVASDFTRNFGVSASSFPQVIFSLGTAPEYPP